MPIEPRPSPWQLPQPHELVAEDLVAAGADLMPGTVLAAYRRSMFPMPGTGPGEPLCWYSPMWRGVFPLERFTVSRSLRQARKRFEIRVDTAFADVLSGCADSRRADGWIDDEVRSAYLELHSLGWAHSVEAWRGGELAGGLYGLAIGGLFAGESMFHRERDASKVALAGLVDLLRDDYAAERLLDTQWHTEHLGRLGAEEIPRSEYVERLEVALELPLPEAFDG